MTAVVVERLVSAQELDEIVEIEASSFHRPTNRGWYETELERPDVCFLYVLRVPEHRVAGFCAFWKAADQIHINNLAIRPQLRRQGLGSLLLARSLEEARRIGATHATLEVRRSNVAAISLYLRAGFEVTGVRKLYYTSPIEDALILARTGGTVRA
ncbi:MAG: ribosomal protein S18-alanine N-acetyltransferase [Acidobacteriota bacterium]